MICDQCQLESEREEIFRKVSRFLKRDRTFCLGCFADKDSRDKTLLFWGCAIGGLLAIPLTLFSYTERLGLMLLNIAALQLLFFFSTVLHELGHALAGKLAGIRIFRIEIGWGQVVYEFRLAGWRWQIRALPFGGVAYGTPINEKLFKIKDFIFTLGGPLANAILLLISIRLLPLDGAFASTPFEGFVPLRLLALTNAVSLFFSLWPRRINTTVGKSPNDGLRLLKIWRYKKAEIAESMVYRYIYEVDECRRQKDFSGMQKWIDDGLRHFPDSFNLKYFAAQNLFEQKKYGEAVRAMTLLIGRQKNHADLDSYILNFIAYSYVMMGKPELLPKADTCSRLALKMVPGLVYHQGTRGTVLAELGQYDEGLKLLHKALRHHPEKTGQALDACHIGIAEARRGNLAESQNYFALARKLDPQCPLLERQPQPVQCPPG